MVQQHLGFGPTLERVGIPPTEGEEVAAIFRHPEAIDVTLPPFGPVDEEAVRRLLVEGHGFSEARVKSAIARARTRPKSATSAAEAKGHQTLLDTFGGTS